MREGHGSAFPPSAPPIDGEDGNTKGRLVGRCDGFSDLVGRERRCAGRMKQYRWSRCSLGSDGDLRTSQALGDPLAGMDRVRKTPSGKVARLRGAAVVVVMGLGESVYLAVDCGRGG